MSQICYKVLDPDLRSVGLKPKGKQVPIIQYVIGEWTYPLEPISTNPNKGGGLWVNPTLSQAKVIVRYLRNKYQRKVRIFRCRIGRVLCQPSDYRLKTDKVMIFEEVLIN